MTRIHSEVIVVSSDTPLAAHELAQACGAEVSWIVDLVEVGILTASPVTSTLQEWRFLSTDLQAALDARRLERDLGIGLEAAALILDLQRELRRLKGALLAHGIVVAQ